jgi:uncharacterized protein YbbC (DUF1343 family)/CubicO group peptidase (beta-lactamase class C family)
MRDQIFVFITQRLKLAALLLVILAFAYTSVAQPTPAPDFTALDAILQDAVAKHAAPGFVCLVGHNGQIVYRKAFGERSLEPIREPMTLDAIFDMASLTKVIVTTTSVMKLVQDGKVKLNDPVAAYLPEFRSNDKGQITVRMLLTHYSGLPEDLDLKTQWQGKDTAFRMAMDAKPIYPPGARFLYSDINFEVLGFLVERVSGMALDEFAAREIFEPLQMSHTRFLPPREWLAEIAPTEYDEHHHMLHGVVHDPTARRMGGVAGHAGLFSTADDTAIFAQELLHGEKILKRVTVEKMSTPQTPPWAVNARGLGWDIDSPFSSNRGELLPVGSFGHTGFTGTSLWIDPVTDTYIILLSNAVHPNGHGNVISVRTRVATAVAAALKLNVTEEQKLRLSQITGYNETVAGARRIAFRNGQVKQGIDVLEAHDFVEFHPEQGKRKCIGLVTNHTGVDAAGRRSVDVLAHAPGIDLVAIFSPEHGFAGAMDTTAIGNSRDPATGVPVYSVYGGTDAKRRPSADVMKTLDAVVYDIQDIGVRYYTYETTLGYFLEAAAKSGKEIFVLDRVNPITGAFVQGPVADVDRFKDLSSAERASREYTAYSETPVRHGMTVGELAKMWNTERRINAKLTVIPVEGWERGDWYDSTGLLWINQSPNMRSLNEATLYPGVGLIEGTNISVGRGTDTPFEVVGAPWIKAVDFANYLNQRGISGVRFVPITFTPTDSNYAHQLCQGVNIFVVDRNQLDGPELGVELAGALHKLYPNQWKLDKMIDLLVNQSVFQAIQRDEDPRRIADDWQDELEKFEDVRKKYLMY